MKRSLRQEEQQIAVHLRASERHAHVRRRCAGKIMNSVLRMSVGRGSPAGGARPASMRRATVQIPPSIVLSARHSLGRRETDAT